MTATTPAHSAKPTPAPPPRPFFARVFAWRYIFSLAALGCLALWTLNFWVWPQLGFESCVLHIRHGAIEFSMHDPLTQLPEDLTTSCLWLSELPGYDVGSRFGFFRWRPSAGSFPRLSGNGRLWYLDLPLWLPFAAFSTLSILAWRAQLKCRHAPRACPHCHYDLTGLPPTSPCPECGR